AGAWVLVLPSNQGKGGAVAAGVAATPETDVYLLVDADVGATAAAAGALLGPVLRGEADMTVGVLPSAGGRGGLGMVRDLAAAGIRRATGSGVEAPLSGQRAVRASLLRDLVLAPRFGLETALTIDARWVGARVVEIPVPMDHRHTGRTVSGFAHRARQGADVVQALWPRLTTPRIRTVVTIVATTIGLLAALFSAGRWEADSVAAGAASKVLIVGVPGLGWDDLGRGRMPNLDRMVDDGALGAMTVRTRSGHPSVTEGYATLGAGSRVAASDGNGQAEGDAPVRVPAVAALRSNAGRNLPTAPGALGQALHAAGKRTAVVGNADLALGLSDPVPAGEGEGRPVRLRPAAVAVMDGDGRVDAGLVGHDDVLVADPSASFGLRGHTDRIVEATRRLLGVSDVVLVDPGDLTRAKALEALDPPAWFVEQARTRALADTDALLGRLTTDLDSRTVVLVVSVVPPSREWRLTPMVAAGAGVTPGYLHSPSTRRLGLVALTDLAPTVLGALGARVPVAMVGHPVRYVAGVPDARRLVDLDRAAAFREGVYLPLVVAFIALQALVYLLTMVAFSRRRPGYPWWRAPLRLVVLAFAAFPLATFLLRAVPGVDRGGLAAATVGLLVIDSLLVAAVARARRHTLSSLSWLLGATAAVLIVDVATGGRLQQASIMGYSPHTAGRFYGLGNSAFAVLAAASLLGAVLHFEHAPRRREALVSVAVLFGLVVVVDGAPSLGDDVGGILTLVPVFALTVLALARRRVTLRLVAGVVLATVVVLGLATAIDLSRPPEARTHLGRQVVSIGEDGPGTLLATMTRKAEVNLRILGASAWTWTVPVIAVFMLEMLVRQRRGADLLPRGSPMRVGVVAALATGILGAAVNDSGVVVTALVLVYVGPFLALLALARGENRVAVLMEPAIPASAARR
ncbi:MAG: hypothetical protein ACRD0Q_10760, partial [Acidimicrobiales bacterium]